MLSERHLDPTHCLSGSWHDDTGWCDGWDPDIIRARDSAPRRDSVGGVSGCEVGSAHAVGVNCLFGGGTVRGVDFSITPQNWLALCMIADGTTVDLP